MGLSTVELNALATSIVKTVLPNLGNSGVNYTPPKDGQTLWGMLTVDQFGFDRKTISGTNKSKIYDSYGDIIVQVFAPPRADKNMFIAAIDAVNEAFTKTFDGVYFYDQKVTKLGVVDGYDTTNINIRYHIYKRVQQ